MRVELRCLVAAACLCGAAATAADPPRFEACQACHATNAPLIPQLAGQPRLYLENKLVLVRDGMRDIPAMKAVMEGLSDEDIIVLARHYAALPAPAAVVAKADATRRRAGAALAERARCASCHLPNYAGQQQVPRLAGQHEAYLLQSLRQYRDAPGPGRDTLMTAALQGLADADLANLSHYLAALQP